MPDNVTLAQVLRANNAALKAGLHTSMPGVIKSYDPETKTADIQPVLRTPMYDPETGDPMEAEELPVIPNVPVQFPRGGGWHMSFPLEPGNHVTLVFSEAATGQWRSTGEISEVGDVRRHSLGYPTALPGAHPDAEVLADDANPLYAGMLVLGKDGDPTQSIRIGPSGIEVGGALPMPLAMGPGTATVVAAIGAWIAACTAALAANPDYTTFKAAMVAPGATVATAIGAAATAIPATISKGQ